MHCGSGSLAELDRLAKEKYREDDGDVVLRTATLGHTQGKLEVCARWKDVVDKDGTVLLQSLGEKLPVVAGFLASCRYEG